MPSLTKKMISGKPYYYLRECKRVNGKPKIIWTLYLGSPDTIRERFVRPEPRQIDLCDFGASAAAYDVARTLGVVEVIDRHVPKGGFGPTVGEYLLLATLNRCVAPRSKMRLGRWYQKTVLRRLLPFSPGQLTSQRFWDNMDRVEPEHIVAIERELSSAAVRHFDLDLRCLLFDATNFFTFIDSFNDQPTLPQRGKSKEGRSNLRIIGLALLVTSDGDVPLFHHTYAGNQNDTVTFGSVAEQLAERCRQLGEGVCDITLVFDKGNNSEANLDLVAKGPYHFVGSLVPTHHRDLLAIPRKKMRRLEHPQLPAVWSYRTKKEVFGVERTVLCTFNQPLFDAQRKTLQREIAKRKRKLSEIKDSLERYRRRPRGKAPTRQGTENKVVALLKARHMKDLFATRITVGATGLPALSFRFRDKAWKELQRTLLGKTLLFTDQGQWADEQIVLGYRSQHHVEAAFRRMKDPRFLTFRPAFHWTDQKLRVHAFYCVLALMILSLLRRKLEQANVSVSIVRMMEQLADIREIALVYNIDPETKKPAVRTTLSHRDEQQEAMLAALDLARYQAA